jgi:hypothetical protein
MSLLLVVEGVVGVGVDFFVLISCVIHVLC